MDILDSSLGADIKSVMNSDPTDSNYYWTCEIHCGPDDDIDALKVLSIDFNCDFENNFTDEVILRAVIGGGQYAYHVYPFLSQLEITLYKVPVDEVAGGVVADDPSQSERYVATLLNPRNPAVESNQMNQPSEFTLDLTNLLECDFQLVTKPVEQFRLRTYGAIFRKQTVQDVIKHVMTEQCKIVDTDDIVVPLGVDMVDANNVAKREHIVIPQGKRVVDIPGYIHQTCGVYNSGMASYFQGDHWYIFPPYNNANFDQNPKQVTIINVPANRMPAIERTYKKDGNNLLIIATGDTKLKNESEKSIGNEGNGVRFGDANQFMENFTKTEDNKSVAGRGGNNSEFTTIKRETGLNNVQQADSKITANPFTEYSKLAARDGSIVMLSWEHSNPAEIYPGMPVKILYLQDDDVNTIFGLVIKAHHYVNTVGQGFQTNRHFTTSNLMVFCKRDLDATDST